MPDKSALQEEIGQSRPFPNRRVEAVLGLLRTADVLRHRLDEVFAPYGLTHQQYNVLRILRGARPDPLPTMEIAERMVEKTPGITRLIDRLEKKDLVARERRPDDRRCIYCSITPEGLALLERLDGPVAEADAATMAMLSREDVARLIEMLDAIRADNR